MKRNSITFPLKAFLDNRPDLMETDIEVRVDEQNAKEIISFLLQEDKKGKLKYKKKFQRILYTILKNRYDEDLYSKEEVTDKAKNVTAIKFKGKENFRIACKELKCKNKKIIMVTLFHKKTQGNSKKEITCYETVGGYEYDC